MAVANVVKLYVTVLATVCLNGCKFVYTLKIGCPITRQDAVKDTQFIRNALRPSGIRRRCQNDLPPKLTLLRNELEYLVPKRQLADFGRHCLADGPLECGSAMMSESQQRVQKHPWGLLK